MKKILYLLLFVSCSFFAQNFNKEDLTKEFELQFNASHNEEAYLVLNLLESNFGLTEELKYYKHLLDYYVLKERIENKKTFLIFATIKNFEDLINSNNLTEKRVNTIKRFKVIISFALLYYREHKISLSEKIRKEIADNIIAESKYLISPNVLEGAEKSDIERILKKTKDNYDYYTGPIKKIGM